jgi:hypothetical protein
MNIYYLIVDANGSISGVEMRPSGVLPSVYPPNRAVPISEQALNELGAQRDQVRVIGGSNNEPLQLVPKPRVWLVLSKDVFVANGHDMAEVHVETDDEIEWPVVGFCNGQRVAFAKDTIYEIGPVDEPGQEWFIYLEDDRYWASTNSVAVLATWSE